MVIATISELDVFPHGVGGNAVELGHGICFFGEAQRTYGHIEGATAEGFQFFPGEAHIGPHVHDFLNWMGFVALDDGRMGRKYDGRANCFEGLLKFHFFFFYFFTEEFETGEKGVSFIEMVKIGVDAELAQGPNAADAQYHFLGDALFTKPAIELSGDPGILASGHIGVEEINIGIAEFVHFPDFAFYRYTADFYDYGDPGVHEKIVNIVVIGIIRPSIRTDALVGITLFPFDPNSNNRIIVVFGTFEIIAGQDTQATGIGFHRLVEGIFHTEIGNYRLF